MSSTSRSISLPVSFRKLLKKGQTAIGSWLTIPEATVAEIMAKAGFDWLVIDMEHSPIGVSMAEQLIRVVNLCGLSALVRVGENDPCLIKRVMDSGASGVIVPMVNSTDDAQRAVEAVKYPPKGKRGVGLARAQGYGRTFNEYQKWAEEESVVIVQIEHIHAVNNMESILAVEGIDGFLVGPYDLSASLGVPGQFQHKGVLEALRHVKRVMTKISSAAGFHVVQPDVKLAHSKFQEGYSFVAIGTDFIFLDSACRGSLQDLRKAKSKP